ncbi:hypothetical protein [Alicyclobacillus fastidiosus]|uniref:Baseplate protein J-like domain-containing protein n=1 Tax=Alicyclobacillus fastidiosus TaxID=392011 RepID=A0ABV5ALF1_9BACL|nr:hypothetical protein [Alicyclobacillus fastidiosus]WEH08479.1 hypothetical protein PYS47_17555 [Alicyclobacillus fastidiosus]
MAREDQQLALYEFFGGFSTTLAADAPAGSTTISVNASRPIDTAKLDMGSLSESVSIKDVTGNGPFTVTLKAPTQYDHSAGAVLAPYRTSPSSTFPDIKTVAMGEPFEARNNMQPILFVTSPTSQEKRQYAQEKLITYNLSAVLVQILPAKTRGAEAESTLDSFYRMLDEIAAQIRTNKMLITPSYPLGASMKFGESFRIQESHQRTEVELYIVSKIDIESIEQVHA